MSAATGLMHIVPARKHLCLAFSLLFPTNANITALSRAS